MAPLVTVLLPTHDRPDVLGIAIRSVLSQSVMDFELLIVGDGCANSTREVVASFSDRRIIWFNLPKAPLSGYANRNIALHQARGRYVAYAQDDDIWFPDHLALLLKSIEGSGADWTYSCPLWVGRNGALVPCPVNLTLPDELEHFMTVENSVPSTCVLHTRSALDRVGYWPENTPSVADWMCWRAMISSSVTPNVGHCRSVTCLHFPTIVNTNISIAEAALRDSAHSCWWPAILRLSSAECAGQETLWRALCDGGLAWVAAIRAATDTVIDHVALTAIRQWRPLTDEVNAAVCEAAQARAEAEEVRAQREAARADAHAAIAAAQLARDEARVAADDARAARAEALRHREALDLLFRSRSWRMTAPLRAIATALRR